MGQEASQPIDPSIPPTALSSRSLEGVAQFIKDGKAKNIVVMTGAGVSTSAGIPDFRSPETGLYANLARLDLPYAEAVFDISYFRENPQPFYMLAKELYPGQFYPTITHSFIALLGRKNLLRMLFTQNIDCLERRAGVPAEKIVEAHGSFATQRCIDCKTEFPEDLMLKMVNAGDVPHCLVPECNGLVKPDIVFFGEALPQTFHQNIFVPGEADLAIVMGTSLSVQPFASLPSRVSEGVPRVLFNNQSVGDFGSRLDDVVVIDDCDNAVRKLADALGWRGELEELWDSACHSKNRDVKEEEKESMSKDEILESEIKRITDEVDTSLHLAEDHRKWVNEFLEKDLSTKGLSPSLSFVKSEPDSEESQPEPAVSSDITNDSKNSMIEKVSGLNDAPSKLVTIQPTPQTTDKAGTEASIEATTADTTAILDLNLPQNKLIDSSDTNAKRPGSHI